MAANRLEQTVTIRNPRGLHMRFAAAFAEAARQSACAVHVRKGDSEVNGKGWARSHAPGRRTGDGTFTFCRRR